MDGRGLGLSYSLQKSPDLVKLDSCFGGMAIYRYVYLCTSWYVVRRSKASMLTYSFLPILVYIERAPLKGAPTHTARPLCRRWWTANTSFTTAALQRKTKHASSPTETCTYYRIANWRFIFVFTSFAIDVFLHCHTNSPSFFSSLAMLYRKVWYGHTSLATLDYKKMFRSFFQ